MELRTGTSRATLVGLSEPLRSARRVLPLLPEEVFTLWLDAAIAEHGWPPSGEQWSRVLLRRPISFWQTIRWTKRSIDISRANLAADTRYPARALAMAAFEGRPSKYAELAAASSERLARIAKQAQTLSALPGSLASPDAEGYSGGRRRDAAPGSSRRMPTEAQRSLRDQLEGRGVGGRAGVRNFAREQ